MDAVDRARCKARGYPESKIKVERFAAQHPEARARRAGRCRAAAQPNARSR